MLYDCVPSKTFIASAGARSAVREPARLGVVVTGDDVGMTSARVHERVQGLARGPVRGHPHRA